MFRRLICALLAPAILLSSAFAMDRAELRAAWREMVDARSGESPYAERPDPSNFALGSLTERAQSDALALTNLIRKLAGLEPVALDELYALRAQAAALVLAANDVLTHEPERPSGAPDDVYEVGFAGASMSNIAKFNWMRPDMLVDGVTYFVRDDGIDNLNALGHRRWLLNPCMASTGFGLANAVSGNSYVAMYAVDMGNADTAWDSVAWPAAGSFPVELMRAELPWSVTLNPQIYDVEGSNPVATLVEENSGASFRFDFAAGAGDGFCQLNTAGYGPGPCLIFRPDIARAGIEEYVQNQRWAVEIVGLMGADGEEKSLRYVCEMASVYPQDVANVELDVLEASMQVGERLQLTATVIPEYADDLNVAWSSSDPGVASVDAEGLVAAIAPGACEITASSANGRADVCRVAVE